MRRQTDLPLRGVLFAAAAVMLASGTARAEEQRPLNQPPPGFVALFNGRDLTNWQGLIDIKRRATLTPEQRKEEQAKADAAMREHWTVRDGILRYDGKNDSLQTVKDYGNFELWVDWKIQKGGDSGIYLRGNPQVQIWDNPIGSGGLYNNKNHAHDPLVFADNPPGEWNTFWIRMVGDRVTVKLNGKLVVDNTPLENYWFPGQPLPTRGPIELQHHGSILEWRNIFLKELPDDAAHAAPEPRPDAPAPAGGLITMELEKAPLSRVIQLLSANGGVDIILTDPDGTLARREVSFISIRKKPVQRAIEQLCRAAGLDFAQDGAGVYVLAPRKGSGGH